MSHQNHQKQSSQPQNTLQTTVSFEAVQAVIHEWDPYGLLALGCPGDEFDGEIRAVFGQIYRIVSVHDAVHVLSRVFSSSFEPEMFRPEACRTFGEQLFGTLRDRGVVGADEM